MAGLKEYRDLYLPVTDELPASLNLKVKAWTIVDEAL